MIKLYFIQQSESGKAWQFVMAPTKKLAGSTFVWLPVSMIWRKKDHAIVEGEDYPRWDVTIPQWLAEQKTLMAYEIGKHHKTESLTAADK